MFKKRSMGHNKKCLFVFHKPKFYHAINSIIIKKKKQSREYSEPHYMVFIMSIFFDDKVSDYA